MPTPTKGARLGSSPSHEKALLANLATALFEHGRITTTQAKARRLRPVAERLITKAKRGDLHARRQVMTTIRDAGVVHALFTEIGPRYANRPGGYTRIVKIGPRKGDNAPMAVIELVEPLAEQVVSEAEGATRRAVKEAEQAQRPEVAEQTDAVAEGDEPEVEESEVDEPEVDETEADAAGTDEVAEPAEDSDEKPQA